MEHVKEGTTRDAERYVRGEGAGGGTRGVDVDIRIELYIFHNEFFF